MIGGSLNKKKNVKAYVQTISKKEDIIKQIHLINGYFRTPKIKAFHNLITHFNQLGYNINILPLDFSPLINNNWFAGFIDADGSFHIRISNHPFKVACQFELEQRQFDISGVTLQDIKQAISTLLQCNVLQTKNDTKNPKFRIRTTSLAGNLSLIHYLDKFPLKSSKYLDFLNWKDAFYIFKNKEHLTNIGLDRIKYLKLSNNDRRKEFNWDHLKNFFMASP